MLDEFCPAGRPADLTTCAAPPPGGGGAVVPVEPAADACAPNAWQILAALFSSLILCAIVLACCATAHPALSDVLPAAWTDAAADSGVDGAVHDHAGNCSSDGGDVTEQDLNAVLLSQLSCQPGLDLDDVFVNSVFDCCSQGQTCAVQRILSEQPHLLGKRRSSAKTFRWLTSTSNQLASK